MADGGFNWWLLPPWLMSAGALYWNWLNANTTRELQKNVRDKTIRLEEFRSHIRGPIDSAIELIRQSESDLEALEASAADIPALKANLIPFNQQIVERLGQLEDALLLADDSEFADGADWCACIRPHNDDCLIAIDTAINPNRNGDDTLRAVATARGQIATLHRRVRSRVESEVKKYLV